MASKGQSSTKKAVKKTLKRGLRKIPGGVKVLMTVFLLIGLAAGAIVCKTLSKNDHFDLNGNATFTVEVGDTLTYADEGVSAVCFGLDCSGKVEIETKLEKDGDGNYVIPTDKEGVYTIVYTVNVPKFNGMLSGETIKRIRTFTVVSTEEDGHNG